VFSHTVEIKVTHPRVGRQYICHSPAFMKNKHKAQKTTPSYKVVLLLCPNNGENILPSASLVGQTKNKRTEEHSFFISSLLLF
jgi:hypothetical protein